MSDRQMSDRQMSGDVLRIPAGHKHSSGGDRTAGALFYD